MINLKHEHEKMVDICQQEEKQIERLKHVLDIVEKCEGRLKAGSEDPLSLKGCALIFKSLRDEYYEEYKIYDLATMALAVVFPLVSSVPQQNVTTFCPKEFTVSVQREKRKYFHAQPGSSVNMLVEKNVNS